MRDLEHIEQKALIDWCDLRGKPYSQIYAIPNGGHRHITTAKKLKREGVRAGMPDLCLPISRRGFNSLYIEMKVGKNKPTKLQLEKIDDLTAEGNLCVICWGWESAKNEITNYIEG